MGNQQFFKEVISIWGLEETWLRQSIYFSFVAPRFSDKESSKGALSNTDSEYD
jgi:hypothetical protein